MRRLSTGVVALALMLAPIARADSPEVASDGAAPSATGGSPAPDPQVAQIQQHAAAISAQILAAREARRLGEVRCLTPYVRRVEALARRTERAAESGVEERAAALARRAGALAAEASPECTADREDPDAFLVHGGLPARGFDEPAVRDRP